MVDARREEREGVGVHIVDADERVIDTVADERDLRPVGRPDHVAVGAPRLDERRAVGHGGRVFGRIAREWRVARGRGIRQRPDLIGVNLSVLREQHRAAVW
jgi:hypothetical protein